MRASATGLKSSQATLKLSLPEGNSSLQAAGAATLKLPPESMTTKRMSSVMTLKPHQAVRMSDIETIWDAPKPITEHSAKMHALPKGVDRMSSAFKDATKTKEEKRNMMDDMHETSMERVETTRKEMEELLQELGLYLKAFYVDYEEKLKVTLEELRSEEEERIVAINKRFQILEERQQALKRAIDEERETRLHNTEAILGPARRSVEMLVHDLEKERRIRHTRNTELKQRLEDAAKMLAEALDGEQRNREARHEQVVKELEIDVKRLQKRGAAIEQCNAEKVAAVQDDLVNEEKHRKEGQDTIVVKITDFVRRFQAHIKEEGEMGC